ncbi:1,2-dihydroxy-3-keto-5-methylthiopentene dioxygenase [Sporothrix eucalyptigena]|uniref:1,2-dihydroxy-3-keto-5-methylthiopentene dioxygenase n=1 Tax=Sporothrix eucalyptigena TaxID=1812306 RepID=A0ABP0BVT0_9PEZI
MKMMDMTYDGMLDEAFLGTTTATTAAPLPTAAVVLPEETGYSDLSVPSSTISTPGTGIGGRAGATGASGGNATLTAAVAGARTGGAVPTAAGGATGGWTESGDLGNAANANQAGSGAGGSGNSNTKSRVQLPSSCDPPLPDTPTKPLVWIVFGGTGHMGRSLVKSALAHGDYVTTVGRLHETSMAGMQALAASAAELGPDDDSTSPAASMASPAQSTASAAIGAGAGLAGNKKMRCLGALCDVRARESVDRVVQKTLAHFGRIDVVANCSGYGVVGACEDQDEHELRNQFETNYMGTLHILQATLPILRRQQEVMLHQQQVQGSSNNAGGGRYLIFSSTAGALGVPGLGPYCATKYAVEGLIEAMLYEVDAFNIKATLVEPGLMRRDDWHWEAGDLDQLNAGVTTSAGRSSGNRGDNTNPLPTWGHFLIKPPSESYANASAPSLHATRMVQWLGDRQPASVVQCAELVWQLAHCSFPPLRLPLGSYAIESIRDRMRSVTEEIEDWKHLNFPLPPEVAPAGSSSTPTAGGGAGASSAAPSMTASTGTATTATPTTTAAGGGTTTATSATPATGAANAASETAASSEKKDDLDEEMFDIGS